MTKENLRYSEEAGNATVPGSPGISQGEADMLRGDARPSDPLKPSRKASKGRKAMQDLLGGDYLSREWFTGNLYFILYVALLAMIYIGNTYYTEKKFNSIERTKKELKELRYQYITTKSVLMFQGRQSQIAKRAQLQGLRETTMPPYKILYSGDSLTSKHN